MSRFLLVLFTTVFAAGLAPRQDPKPKREPKPSLTKTARLANKKRIAQMQGAWKLVDMRLVDQDAVGMGEMNMEQVGFCLVGGNYLSIEFHVRIVAQGGADAGRSVVTGLHHFEFDESGDLETSVVIATRTGVQGVMEFEPPGNVRHYAVSVEGETMTLAREDGHTLVFERLMDDTTRVDFFGRQVTEKEEATEDEDKADKKKDEGDEDEDP